MTQCHGIRFEDRLFILNFLHPVLVERGHITTHFDLYLNLDKGHLFVVTRHFVKNTRAGSFRSCHQLYLVLIGFSKKS